MKYYLGDNFSLGLNHKLRDVLEILRRDESIEVTSEMSIILRWKVTQEREKGQDTNTTEQEQGKLRS